MADLQLSLLGPFTASLNDQPLKKFRTNRVQALLVYLATESALGSERHRREALMELLWPGLPLKSAQMNLRQAIYHLRKAVPDKSDGLNGEPIPFLLSDRQSVQINPDYPTELDLTRFVELLAGDQGHWPEAIALYRGDFLTDFYLPDANPFEEWAAARRAAFRRQVLDALDKLTEARIDQGAFADAEGYGRQQLEIDKLREGAYRQLMRLYAWSGRQSEALALYQEYARLSAEELGAMPDQSTTDLYEAIREQRLSPPPQQLEEPPIESVPAAEPQPTIAESPYRGLYAFRGEDAPFFFGREVFAERLVETAGKQLLLAIVGPSGSGKSSVLHAGLIARLRAQGSWIAAAFRPGSDPFQALAAALLPLLEPELHETERLVETRRLSAALGQGELPLDDVLARIVGKSQDADRLLLAADQFEELYTLCPEPEDRVRFLEMWLEAAAVQQFRPEPIVAFALTLRADFLGQALSFRPFADALQDADLKLGPMTREELARAIVKPAEIQGVAFERGLVERILDDVADAPGNLPLLQFALTALWERQADCQLSHAAYDEIGRVQGALARYADQVYSGLSEDEREAAHRVFIQMVHPGARTEDTRRLTSRTELTDGDWVLAQRLADARLVVTGRDPSGMETAELVHEALIQRWERLQGWMEADRAFRTWQERLRAALRQWQASERDEGALLRGIPLAEAEGRLQTQGERLSASERQFIQASLDSRDRRQAEKEAARVARERLRRRITLGMAAGLIVAILLAALAGWQWSTARRAQEAAEIERDQTQAALSASLASQALLLLDSELDLSLLLAVEAVKRVESSENETSLFTALTHSPRIDSFLHGHEDQVRAVAYSPDGRLLATASSDNTVIVWDLASGQPAGPPLTDHTDEVRSVAFSPDGRVLASAGFDNSIILWDLDSLAPLAPPLTDHADNIWTVTYSPDGRLLASGDSAGSIVLWDANSGSATFGQPIGLPLAGHEGTVAGLAFDPSSRVLASTGADGTIRLWDVAADSASFGQPLTSPFTGHDSFVRSVTFSPDGRTLATGGIDRTIILWDVVAGSETFGLPLSPPFTEHSDWVTSLAFSPDGQTLASAGRDRNLILWDIGQLLGRKAAGGQPQSQSLSAHGGPVWDVAFSPGGRQFASAGGDHKTIIWDPAQTLPLAELLSGHTDEVSGVAFSPDSQMLASVSRDRTLILWDLAESSSSFGQPVGPPLVGHTGAGPETVVFSPDGKLLASGGRDRAIFLWDTDVESPTFGQQVVEPLTEHDARVFALAFHPKGHVLASGLAGGMIALWDVSEGSATFGQFLDPPLVGHTLGVRGLEFARNGDWLASGSVDQTAVLWDASAMTESPTSGGPTAGNERPWAQPVGSPLVGHSDIVTSLAFSPDERILATGSRDLTIILWDVDPVAERFGEALGQPLTEHRNAVWALAFGPDGNTLASLDQDSQVLIWDVGGGSASLRYPLSPPTTAAGVYFQGLDLAFSPDGRFLAAAAGGNDVFLWDVSLDSWQERACRRANRNLTQEEWRRFFGQEPYRPSCPELAQ